MVTRALGIRIPNSISEARKIRTRNRGQQNDIDSAAKGGEVYQRVEERFRAVRSIVVLVAAVVPATAKETPAAGNAAVKSQKNPATAFLTKIASDYEFKLGNTHLELYETPLLSWSNPVRRSKYGHVFVWTDDKRPRAMACFFFDLKPGRGWLHEYTSLATRPISATWNGEIRWEPRDAGIEWRPLTTKQAPGTSSAQRLLQMRRLAREFQGQLRSEQLRLMSQPLYRYDHADQGIVDGSMFALAQGTNPEIILLIEAIADDTENSGRYALARMTGSFIRVKRAGVTVLEESGRGNGRSGAVWFNNLIGDIPGGPK